MFTLFLRQDIFKINFLHVFNYFIFIWYLISHARNERAGSTSSDSASCSWEDMGGWSTILERSERVLNGGSEGRSCNTSGHGSYDAGLSDADGRGSYPDAFATHGYRNRVFDKRLSQGHTNAVTRRVNFQNSKVVEQARRISRSLSFILGEPVQDTNTVDDDTYSTSPKQHPTMLPPLTPQFPPLLTRTATSPQFSGQAKSFVCFSH